DDHQPHREHHDNPPLPHPQTAQQSHAPLASFFSSRRRHTRWPRDWSSDVCSSDLVSTTRSMIWRTLVSRSGLPRLPRKYFWATTLIASCDQERGTSTSFCSKMTWP